MLMCGYQARIGNTSSRSFRNTLGLRNISETGTDRPAITCGTSASSRSTRAVSAPTLSACMACASPSTRRFSDAGA